MKIGFVFTNYNNSSYTRMAIESIAANSGYEDACIVIVDNGSSSRDVERLKCIKQEFPQIELILNEVNSGYFQGLNIGVEYLRGAFPVIKHIVVGNNDLVFPTDFIGLIQKNGNIFDSHAVVCPDLVTLDGVHQNPHVATSISWVREVIWDLYYANYYVSRVIEKVAEITRPISERKDYRLFRVAQPIEQGYGACYILGPLFLAKCGNLWAPTFMMGEEFFISQQLKMIGHKCYYYPMFKVTHHHHATMNRVPSRRRWHMAREAHRVRRKYVRMLPFI